MSTTIADDAERGILSQPKLMQLVLLASGAANGRSAENAYATRR